MDERPTKRRGPLLWLASLQKLGLILIGVGFSVFPVTYLLLRVDEALMNSYGIFDTSWSGRALAVVDATVPPRWIMRGAAASFLGGVMLIVAGIWIAAAPRSR